MKLKSSHVTLRRLRLHAFHGVLSQERVVGGDYEVSLSVKADLSRACQSDDVGDTVNYAGLYSIVEREMAVPSRLIEHVAARIAQAVFGAFPAVEEVSVSLVKLNPPMGADGEGAGVDLTFSNN